MPKKEEITPMMKQFFDLKAKHPDALLLFRCGDFYETYADVLSAHVPMLLSPWRAFHIMRLTPICPN